jgi:ATP-binding cassette, subfamily B, bacterial
MTPKDRQRYYLQHVLLDRGAAKELRACQLAPYLRRRYDALYEERIVELRGVARRRTLRSLAAALVSAAVTAVDDALQRDEPVRVHALRGRL